jgi:hypothetical protein
MAVNLTDRKLYVGGTANNSIEILGGAAGSSATQWTNPNPTLATNLEGIPSGTTFASGTTPIEILEKLLYPYQSVSFSTLSVLQTFPTIVELGTTSTAGNYSATWSSGGGSIDNWVEQSLFLRQTSPSSSLLASGFSITASPKSISHPTYRFITPTALTFQLTGQQDQGQSPSITRTHNWRAKVYYGKSDSNSVASSYSSYAAFAALFSGNPSGLQGQFTTTNNNLGTLTVSWPSSAEAQHYWLFTPNVLSSFGQYANFKDDNNLQNTPAITGNIVIANPLGLTMDYIYYRWGFPTFGPVNFTVS